MQNDSNLINSIEFTNVTKKYSPHENALRGVNFKVKQGEFVSLIGPSGCGKSTVLKIIAGLEKESSGTVKKPEHISMVFQSGALFPWLTVYENVMLGKPSAGEAAKYIEMMRLKEFVSKYPSELSGGQRQRVGIARALVVNPSVLLLDEPFSALDPKTTTELHEDLIVIWKETKQTIVLVSHLIEEAVSLSEHIFLMKKGVITHEFSINMPYPRREQQVEYSGEVQKIRKEFFA